MSISLSKLSTLSSRWPNSLFFYEILQKASLNTKQSPMLSQKLAIHWTKIQPRNVCINCFFSYQTER